MKRTISIIAIALAIMMIMACLAACGNAEKLTTGTYQLKEVGGNSADLFEEVKDDVILEVEEKNKGTIIIMGVPRFELTFNESSGKVFMDDIEIPYMVEGNTITIEDPSGRMVFKKQ